MQIVGSPLLEKEMVNTLQILQFSADLVIGFQPAIQHLTNFDIAGSPSARVRLSKDAWPFREFVSCKSSSCSAESLNKQQRTAITR